MTLQRWWSIGRKIVAVGRNYAEHAKELGNQVPTEPFFFLKPTSSYLPVSSGNPIEIPPSTDVHHEVELGVIVGRPGRDISINSALDHVAGYALALDLTARNLQNEAKSKGYPWTQAKGFDTFCPVSEFIDKSVIPDPNKLTLWLKVDGELRQRGGTNQMIFKIPELIHQISKTMTLEIGDFILTGTPSGVGSIKPNQIVTAGIDGIVEMQFSVINRPLPENA